MGKRPKLRLGGCNGGGLIHPAMVGGTHLKTIFIIVFFLNATHKYQRSELNDWNRNDVAKMALKREMRWREVKAEGKVKHSPRGRRVAAIEMEIALTDFYNLKRIFSRP